MIRPPAPEALTASVEANIEDWRAGDKVRGFWQHDALPWTGADEANWIDWLDVTTRQIARSEQLRAVVADVKARGDFQVLAERGRRALHGPFCARTLQPFSPGCRPRFIKL